MAGREHPHLTDSDMRRGKRAEEGAQLSVINLKIWILNLGIIERINARLPALREPWLSCA